MDACSFNAQNRNTPIFSSTLLLHFPGLQTFKGYMKKNMPSVENPGKRVRLPHGRSGFETRSGTRYRCVYKTTSK